jgi:hypothetical protein
LDHVALVGLSGVPAFFGRQLGRQLVVEGICAGLYLRFRVVLNKIGSDLRQGWLTVRWGKLPVILAVSWEITSVWGGR